MPSYSIKCDDCGTEIGRTDSVRVSAAGGHCDDCQAATDSFITRAQADQQTRRLAELTARCQAGIAEGWLTEAHGLAAIAGYEAAARAGRL